MDKILESSGNGLFTLGLVIFTFILNTLEQINPVVLTITSIATMVYIISKAVIGVMDVVKRFKK